MLVERAQLLHKERVLPNADSRFEDRPQNRSIRKNLRKTTERWEVRRVDSECPAIHCLGTGRVTLADQRNAWLHRNRRG